MRLWLSQKDEDRLNLLSDALLDEIEDEKQEKGANFLYDIWDYAWGEFEEDRRNEIGTLHNLVEEYL